MPEGIEQGYQPSDQELQLGQEHLESMGITEEPTERGIQHVQAGRVIDRTEKYDNTQAIQYEYRPDGGVTEHAKITAGEKAGQEYRREHPMTQHQVRLTWHDPNVGTMDFTFPAALESLGQTTTSGADGSHEPWARFVVTDQPALEAFASLDRPAGKTYAVLAGELGGDFEIEVNGRRVVIERIGKVSVDFGPDGMPTKATIHKITWSEAPEAVTG